MYAILNLANGSIFGNITQTKSGIIGLIFVSIWFAYLQKSKKVKAVIPETIREWKKQEKILLFIFIIGWFGVLLSYHM